MLTRISGKRPGQTMIEIAVATIIAAITTVAVFSVILSGFVSQRKADKKELVAMLLKDAQQTLQAFVSADVTTSDACGGYCAPNAGGVWTGVDASGGWALRAGVVHDISSLMNLPMYDALKVNPATPCVAGGACYFTYTVGNSDCLGGAGWVPPQATNTDLSSCKTVTFDIAYAD